MYTCEGDEDYKTYLTSYNEERDKHQHQKNVDAPLATRNKRLKLDNSFIKHPCELTDNKQQLTFERSHALHTVDQENNQNYNMHINLTKQQHTWKE